jgi:hypothetical protein
MTHPGRGARIILDIAASRNHGSGESWSEGRRWTNSRMQYSAAGRTETEKMVESGTASEADLDLLFFTDSIEETMDIIRTRSIKKFGLKPVERRPWKILGEWGMGKITGTRT